jgi:UDP-N-acetylmuramate: L-alanyl-gamma-D-glutamyl-meso-diaminopimelate ligase
VGVTPAQACDALARFQNVKRRMELRGMAGGVSVYDDFAHHPTAIRTTLDGLRRKLGSQARILAVFEPRSNTMKLGTMKSQLPWALESADLVFCHTAGLDWDAAEALRPLGVGAGHKAQVAADIDTLIGQIRAAARPGDHVVCMSNGGFGGIHPKLLAALQAAG